MGDALGFECERAWSVSSEPSPPGEILLILQDPTHCDARLPRPSQRDCTLPSYTAMWHESERNSWAWVT